MGRRHLLTGEERAALFGVPTTRDALAKHYTLDATDLEFVLTRRTPANRLGFAAALALLRHPGLAPSAIWPPPTDLIAYLAEQLGIDPRRPA
jgi:TnpA family transposase